MNLLQLLRNSAQLLKERPSIFAPKLFTNLISSIWIISIFLALESGNLNNTVSLMLFFPIIMFLGLAAPVIVAETVKNTSSLKQAINKTIKNTPKIFAATIIIFTVSLAASIPLYTGLGLVLAGYNILFLIFGALSTLAILITFSFLIYFLPVTLTESGPFKSILSSSKASNDNKAEVAAVMIFSFVLLSIAAFSTGPLRNIGFFGFVIGRAISSIVGTYTVVISPKMYAELTN